MVRHLLILLILTCGANAQADTQECSELFLPSYRMAAVRMVPLDPRITQTQLKDVAQLKTELDRGVLRYFTAPSDLGIRVGLGNVRAYFNQFDHLVDFPFSYPVAILPPRDRHTDRYYKRNGVQFKTRALFAHEYTHAVLEPEFLKRIPRYRDYFPALTRLKAEHLSEDAFLERIATNQDLMKIVRAYRMSAPYNEFLADLSTALHFDDPKNPSKNIREFGWKDAGKLAKLLLAWTDRTEFYRDFDFKYQEDLMRHHPSLVFDEHLLLGPTRTATWKVYMKIRDKVPAHVFFRAVVDVALCDLTELLNTENPLQTMETATSWLPMDHDVAALNDRLSRRIEALTFDRPVPPANQNR